MRGTLLLFAVGLVLFPSTHTLADEVADAEATLKEHGIRVLSTGPALTDESKLSEHLRDSATARRKLAQATKKLESAQNILERHKAGMTAAKAKFAQLNAQLANVKAGDVSTNNKIVGALNALSTTIELEQSRQNKIIQGVNEVRREMNEAREQYITEVLAMRELADKIETEYQTKAADPKVREAIAVLAKAEGKEFALEPSRSFASSLRRLKSLEDTVLTEAIPLRIDGSQTPYVSVVINGKHTKEMVVDSGASILALPHKFAEDVGIVASPTDPKITLQLADGSRIEGTLVNVPSVRVGKFTVKDVEAAILGPEAVNASALLGMSFLNNFKFEIDSAAKALKMVKVETAP